MTRSSPAGRRSQALTSPDRGGFITRLLNEERNTEYSHRDALAAAQLEHERVREAALRVYQLHELREEHNRILEAERKEEERLKAEAAIVAEELRLRELRAKSIPKPPPEPKSEPPRQPQPQPQPTKQPEPQKEEQQPVQPARPAQPAQPAQEPPKPSPFQQPTQPKAPASQQTAAQQKPPTQPAVIPAQANGGLPNQPAPPLNQSQPSTAARPTQAAQPSAALQIAEKYQKIHQELKKLRKDLVAASKVAGSPMKGKLGMYRREIRVSIGQLTAGRGANATPIGKISEALQDAISGKVPSPLIDVSPFVVDGNRQPAEGALHNDQQMPALFIYLINICAKGIINQFINEGGANPKAADPVGVFAAHIFSNKEFQWRGQPLIDILMAKFRMVCPVLFGLRGNDKMQRGRLNLGWKKEGDAWISEQAHNDRMTGLGAGFAALSLRDFSKSTKSNPYPPTNYWQALARILNTPANETSNTQYIVLRSMIEGHEQRFLTFYGNAALAALRLALVEFPKKAPPNALAAGSLQALAEVFKGEGLVLV